MTKVKDMIRKQFISEVEQVGDLSLIFTISTGLVDRDQDTVNPLGWDVENYLKNPVVLWAHDYFSPPVAKAPETWIDPNRQALRSKAIFTPEEVYPFGYTIYNLYKEGFLKGVSVGFRPIEYNERGGGIEFLKQELLEYSCVPVPSNPEALIEASHKGINLEPLRERAAMLLDNKYQTALEEVYSMLNTKKIFDMGSEKMKTEKSVIPYKRTPLADEREEWDGPAEIAAAEVDDLKIMCAWFDSRNPDVKSSYKLPHHKAGGEHACVWRGVIAAMAALLGARGGVEIPESDRRGVYNHLAKHYQDFDKEPPEFSEAEIVETKTGRVLSSANEEKLRRVSEAVDEIKHLLDEIFSQLSNEETSIDESAEVAKQPNIDLTTLKETIIKVVNEEVNKLKGKLE